MSPLSEERLNELCGGAPRHKRRCPCGYETRAYYSPAQARDAYAQHRAIHHATAAMLKDEGGGAR